MDNSALGNRLADLIKEQNMSQKELAEKAGITETAVSHYVNGDRCPRSSVLAKLADALGTTSDFLMGGDPQNCTEDITYAKRFIVRNIHQMTSSQKMEIVEILLKDD